MATQKKKALGEDAGELDFKINQNYAQRYDARKKTAELSTARQAMEDLEEELEDTSESEDEIGEMDNEDERQFLALLPLIAKRDAKIYEKDAEFFAEPSEDSEAEGDDEALRAARAARKEEKEKKKPVMLKDYIRKTLLAGNGLDEEDEDQDKLRTETMSHEEEQAQLKRDFIEAGDRAVFGDGAAPEEDDGVFQLRKKTAIEERAEADAQSKFLEQEKRRLGPKNFEDIFGQFWHQDKDLSENDLWLRNFILNKGWVEKEERDTLPTYEQILAEDDDAEEERETAFEEQEFAKANAYRYLDPESSQLLSHPRNVEDSLRKKDTKRAEARAKKKERKELDKKRKKEELKRLKNLMKGKIADQLKKLQETSGIDDIQFTAEDLDKDFDPAEFDKKMQQMFSEDYYEEEGEDAERPTWDDDLAAEYEGGVYDEDEGEGTYEGEEEEEYETAGGEQEYAEEQQQQQEGGEEEEEEEGEEQEEGANIVEGERGLVAGEEDLPQDDDSGKRKRKKKGSAITKKSIDEILSQYYKLDYEDMIGDMPTRFHYKQVKPKRFGWTIDEILEKEDKDLNKRSSLKIVAAPYRQEHKNWQKREKKRRNKERKRAAREGGHTTTTTTTTQPFEQTQQQHQQLQQHEHQPATNISKREQQKATKQQQLPSQKQQKEQKSAIDKPAPQKVSAIEKKAAPASGTLAWGFDSTPQQQQTNNGDVATTADARGKKRKAAEVEEAPKKEKKEKKDKKKKDKKKKKNKKAEDKAQPKKKKAKHDADVSSSV